MSLTKSLLPPSQLRFAMLLSRPIQTITNRAPYAVTPGNQRSLLHPSATINMDGELDTDFPIFPLPDPAEFDPQEIDAAIQQLTERERAMLAWIARGKSNAQLSDLFTLGRNTIEREISRILEVLGIETRRAAAAAQLHWERWRRREAND